MLTYKRKLILTKKQEVRLTNWAGVCRMVYNMGLEIKSTAWKGKQLNVSAYDLQKQITEIRNIDWIQDVPSDTLNSEMIKLDSSYRNFYNGSGFPKFKSKNSKLSIHFKQNDGVLRISGNKINLPKLKEVKIFKDSQIEGKIKTATIVKDATGWFIYIVTDAVKNISNQDESQVIGLDMGVAYFCVDSNGVFIENPKHFKKYEAKLRVENRSLSRKKKGGNGYKKQIQRLVLLHQKITNTRTDFLHKQSTILAKDYHAIYVEDLNIKGMVRSRLAKSISDCSWRSFRTMLEYKTNVVAVNPKYTSQTCNQCGAKDAKSRISQSEFECKSCGHKENADINAAINIMSKGIALNRKREPIGCA